ncbi:TetR/AcrR family transcriptional regulator, partial [Mycobacterium sp. ITM-2017-0098]
FWGFGFHSGFITAGDDAPGVARQLLRLIAGGLLSEPFDSALGA